MIRSTVRSTTLKRKSGKGSAEKIRIIGSKSKYKNSSSKYKGIVYHSIKEASYAREIDLRIMAGELASVRRQVRIPLAVNGKHITTYIIDFVEKDHSGIETYVEVKGFETDVWIMKWRLFEALYPDIPKRIIR